MHAISKRMTDHHESTKYDYDSPSGNPNLTKNKILEYTAAKSEFKAIMNIFYNDKPDGKFTTDIVGNLIRKIIKETMDNHHIYPKSRVNNTQNSNKFNSIANMVLLDSTANRKEIKDKLPSDYFMIIKTKSEGSFYCEQNLIDINEAIQVVSEIEAEKFIDNRAEKIALMINNYFQPKQ